MRSLLLKPLHVLAVVALLAPTNGLAQGSNPFEELAGGASEKTVVSPEMSSLLSVLGGSGSPIDQLEASIDALVTLSQLVPPEMRGTVPCPSPFQESSAGAVGLQFMGNDVDVQSMLTEFPRLKRLVARLETVRDTLPCLNILTDFLKMTVLTLEGRPAEAEAIAETLLPPAGQPFADLIQSARGQALFLQNRLDELEKILERAHGAALSLLGEGNHVSIAAAGSLGNVALQRGEISRARVIFAEQGALARRHLGADHVLTCVSIGEEGAAAASLGDLDEAGVLLQEALGVSGRPCATAIDDSNPWRLVWYRELGVVRQRQGALAEAERHLEEALRRAQSDRGPRHPETITTLAALSELRVAQGRIDEAAELIDDMTGALHVWLGIEIWGTSSRTTRQGLVGAQRRLQELALRIAIDNPDHAAAQMVAARALLRFKGLQVEEDAVLDRLSRSPKVPENVRALAQVVRERRTELAALFRFGEFGDTIPPVELDRRTHALDVAEAALARESATFRNRPAADRMLLERVQAALAERPEGTILIEYARFLPKTDDLKSEAEEEERWAAVIISPETVRSVDLGPVEALEPLIKLIADNEGDMLRHELRRVSDLCAQPRPTSGAILASLYGELVQPLKLPSNQRIVLSPDHVLGLMPFAAFCTAEGKHWIETQALELVQTGRALLPREEPLRAKGFLGLAVEEFGGTMSPNAGVHVPNLQPLPEAVEEVRLIEGLMEARLETPVSVYVNDAADKSRLAKLAEPPRILHLSTHGHYFQDSIGSDRALVRAAVALAGAADPNRDGLLSALEVRSLDLEGTELVAVSACQSALGPPERNEGIAGLVRAFQLAGARNMFVALRNVDSEDARDMMVRFYTEWLADDDGKPADALTAAVRGIIAEDLSIDWTAFALYSG